jgi:hypothetical protein
MHKDHGDPRSTQLLRRFDAHADEGWATCAATELGFIRISANASVVETQFGHRALLRFCASCKGLASTSEAVVRLDEGFR